MLLPAVAEAIDNGHSIFEAGLRQWRGQGTIPPGALPLFAFVRTTQNAKR